ncbi:MAG TPA: twin-arginine translocase TatA/TatE family subunit [Paracoccaceae bacterium]|nr:twin-arginine translocase TatA/TatE family subunit [Paracoccaceae bacterium]
MAPSIWQILIVAVLVVLLFGRGKISSLMGDVAKGIKSFKKGMAEDPDEDDPKKVARDGGEDALDVTPSADKAATAPSEKKDA